jgi:rhombotail lipoprotein
MPFLAGCAGMYGNNQFRYRSSVVDYLYPDQQIAEVASVPLLSLPIRVGVAFVPDSAGTAGTGHISEKDKMDLLVRISSEFKAMDFVKDIELIPTAYLTPQGGFTNLDQIKTMYGIDVMALVSYDQVQHTDEGFWSLSYWTIVGAYIIKGEKNDTMTMLDATVYDIASRKMLFRAPGTHQMKASSTLVNLSEQLRANSAEGLRLAADDLVVNLKAELEQFKQKVKEKPAEYQVVHQEGYKGGGSLGGPFALAMLLLGCLAVWRTRRK